MLARGELQTIGATTLDEYRKYFEKDAALARRFQPIQVGEPTLAQTIEILKGLRDRYEAHHRVVDHRRRAGGGGDAGRPVHLRPVPAGQGDRPDRRGRRPDATADPAGRDRRRTDSAVDLLERQAATRRCEVDDEQIAEVLANWTGIPVYKLTEEETSRLLRMEDELHKRIVGQDDAVKAVSKAIRRTRAGLKDPKRPSGSFIFAGPSGVG